MKYRVLIEALKPTYAWVEVNVSHPMDAIGQALDLSKQMAISDFKEAQEINPGIGLNGCDTIVAPFALLVIDSNGVEQYNRIEQVDALRRMAELEADPVI